VAKEAAEDMVMVELSVVAVGSKEVSSSMDVCKEYVESESEAREEWAGCRGKKSCDASCSAAVCWCKTRIASSTERTQAANVS